MGLGHLKNILVLSVGLLLLYVAYVGLQILQSSLNQEENMGVVSLSVMYGAFCCSCLFLAPVVMKKLGCKWTIVLSMCCFITYTLANFYPKWYTLITSSVLLGLGGGSLWAAKSTYITISGTRHAVTAKRMEEDVISEYFGTFFLILQTCRIWGNLISSLILDFSRAPRFTGLNGTYCGADDCPSLEPTTSTRPSDTVIYTLLGSYTGSGVLGVALIVIFLDQTDQKEGQALPDDGPSFCSTFLSTFRQLADKRQCLLIPLTMFSGFEQGFLTSDYTKSYVTCILGMKFVGYVMICFGGSNAICCLLFGRISQYTGRIPLFVLGAAVHAACIIALLLWNPQKDHFAVFFVLSALWGIGDAVWQTGTSALYGVLFEKNKEAAFSNCCLWESVGFVIAFGYGSFLCAYVKLYILLCVLAVGMLFYGVVEYLEVKKPPITTAALNGESETTTVRCHIPEEKGVCT
ncbi:protein unc-93 homolog A-like [Ambystoma mexicanum]|uniref:protein unc-93 homolog A-like n=1 Tax=Ambystoma mexicanum TaxID=8296 RepID=UPI0037E7B6AC